MISGKRHYRRHHLHVNQSAPGLTTRRRRAQFVRKTTQLYEWQDTTVTIKGTTYLLGRLLGHGGQGAVYAATRSDGEQFAIKMFVWEESTLTKMRLRHPSADSFLRELEFMLELKPISRHFVEFYAVDVDKFVGLVVGYIVMELGTGDLSQMIQVMADKKAHHLMGLGGDTYTHGRDRKFVWRQIVACVKYLHMKNIVNTDLKPGNFITFGKKIKLSDLGLAIATNEPGKHYQGGIGTPTWSAPEVMYPEHYSLKGSQVSRKADIWSLGVILYFMTYGTTPMLPDQYEMGYFDASAPPPGKRRTRDPHLQNILCLTLQMNPANRPNIIQLQQHPYTLSNA